jgi:O-antigen ligase
VQGRYGEVYRLASIFSDPNTFGALLIAVIPFAAFAVVSLRRPGYRVAALLLAILLFTPLFLSFSRGAWVGLAVGGGLAMALINWRALVVTAAVAAVSFWLAIEVPREVLVPTEGPGSNPPNQPSLVDSTVARFNEIGAGKDLRTELVVNALPIVRDHPVLGVGPGRFGGATSWLFGSPVYAEYGTDDVFAGSPQTKTADNFWLHIVVETGALGLAAFLAASLAAGIPILLAARRAQGWYRVLLGGIAAGTAALAANAVTTMLLEANAVAFFTWFLLGIGSLLVARVDAERQTEAAPEALPTT